MSPCLRRCTSLAYDAAIARSIGVTDVVLQSCLAPCLQPRNALAYDPPLFISPCLRPSTFSVALLKAVHFLLAYNPALSPCLQPITFPSA